MDKGNIDPKVLSSITNLELKARLLVEGLYIGLHDSPFYGYSAEFADHRQYYPGDDLRDLDWKVYARTDKYYLKRYEMESDMRVTVLLDSSASMAFGSEDNLTKLDYAIHLAAALVHLVIHQNDQAGLVAFDREIRTFMPPAGSMSHLRQMLYLLQHLDAGESTNVIDVCHQLANRVRKRGLVILISDFFDENYGDLNDCLSHFRFNKIDVIVFHLLDPFEIKFPFKEVQNFRDMETGNEIVTEPRTFQKEYLRRFGEFQQSIEDQCQKANMDYQLVNTEEPLERVLFHYLSKRARMSVR